MKNNTILLDKLENQVILGDSIEVLKTMPDSSVDLIFSDPPYWMRTTGQLKRVEGTIYQGVDDEWDVFLSNDDYNDFTRKWLIECKRVLKNDGSIWVIGGMQCIYSIGGIMQELGFWIINDVIWHKSNPTPNFLGTRLNNSHETLIWATKSEKSKYQFNYKTAKELNISEEKLLAKKKNRKQLGSVWKMPLATGNERLKDKTGKKLHSTQKPEQLLYRIIAISSKLSDVVLDPFAGTMTSGAMAKKLGRKYIMIEKDNNYFKAGKKRIASEHEIIDDIALATYDIVPPRVSLANMIEKGYLKSGEPLYINETITGATFIDNGRIIVDEIVTDIHTYAAKVLNRKANRVNGFDFWYVKRGYLLISIKDIRDEYRKNEISNEIDY